VQPIVEQRLQQQSMLRESLSLIEGGCLIRRTPRQAKRRM
jgi:hypothetical protein